MNNSTRRTHGSSKATDKIKTPIELPAKQFHECLSISIDHSAMKQAENTAVVFSEFSWCYIGSWKAITNCMNAIWFMTGGITEAVNRTLQL